MNVTGIMRMIVAVAALSGVLWCTDRAQSEVTQSLAPPKTQGPQDKQKTERRPPATQEKIHPDVRSKLEKSEDGRVYVLVTLKPLPKEGLTKEQRKALTKEKQDKLLAGLAKDDFEVDHRFETEPRMIGHINAGGLAKLAKQPDAHAVELSKIGDRVIPELNNSPDGKILVMVSLHDVRKDGRPLRDHTLSLREKMILTKQHSSKVIDRLTPADFEVLNQLSIMPSFIGFMKPSAIEILAVDPDVEVVYVNVVHEMGDH